MAGIDNNTVLYLRGDSFNDLSPNPKSITNNGATINNNGKFNKGLNLGNNQYLKVTNGMQEVDLAGDFTIEWWEYSTGASVARSALLTNRSSISSNYCRGILLGHSGTELYVGSSTTTTTWNIVSGAIVKDKVNNVWVHWRLVKQGSKWTSYKDGTKFWSNTYSATAGKTDNNCTIGAWIDHSSFNTGYNAIIEDFRICNYALCESDFVPPSKSYNSITINKTNQTNTNIEFNIEKLGQEVINKVEVLVNGTVSETYTDNYDSINYLIDTELCMVGNNNITIRVAYDDNYTEELLLSYFYRPNPLPLETPLLDTVERVKLLTKSKQSEKTMLSSILTSKNVEVSEEDKMSDLIGKVNLFDNYIPSTLYLYKDGVECESFEIGWTSPLGGSCVKGLTYLECTTPSLRTTVAGKYNNNNEFTTTNKINLINYSKLFVECELIQGHSLLILVRNNKGTSYRSASGETIDNVASMGVSSSGNGVGVTRDTLELDISSLNSTYYISVLSNYTGGTGDGKNTIARFYNIWLEK